MSNTLYLVRHAIAEEYNPGGDAERALTPEGEAKMRDAARGMKRIDAVPVRVLTSPLRRAQQTARIVCDVVANELEPEFFQPLAPGHSGADVLRALGRLRESDPIMLVGHEPDLGRLAALLLTGAPDGASFVFKKGALAAFEVPELTANTRGELLFFLTPKQLRVLGE